MFPWPQQILTNERAVSLFRVASFMQHSSTPGFPWCLSPWLDYPMRIQSQGITTHGRPAECLNPFFSSSSKSPFWWFVWGFLGKAPVHFVQELSCCGSAVLHLPSTQHLLMFRTGKSPQMQLYWGRAIDLGPTQQAEQLFKADLVVNAV